MRTEYNIPNGIMKKLRLSPLVISIFALTAIINSSVSYAKSDLSQDSGDITVSFWDEKEAAILARYNPTVHLYLLDDDEDILAQIEHLREQSKAELEPLVKEYMQTAEALTQLARQPAVGQDIQRKKKQLSRTFTTIEQSIESILERYEKIITARIQQYAQQTATISYSMGKYQFQNILPGEYRIYGIMTFSTTTLKWFESRIVKGGDRHIVYLTQKNMMNPYWTDFNWWSFMNLDFSKHH